MTVKDKEAFADYFDRREYGGRPGCWIAPSLIAAVFFAWLLA